MTYFSDLTGNHLQPGHRVGVLVVEKQTGRVQNLLMFGKIFAEDDDSQFIAFDEGEGELNSRFMRALSGDMVCGELQTLIFGIDEINQRVTGGNVTKVNVNCMNIAGFYKAVRMLAAMEAPSYDARIADLNFLGLDETSTANAPYSKVTDKRELFEYDFVAMQLFSWLGAITRIIDVDEWHSEATEIRAGDHLTIHKRLLDSLLNVACNDYQMCARMFMTWVHWLIVKRMAV